MEEDEVEDAVRLRPFARGIASDAPEPLQSAHAAEEHTANSYRQGLRVPLQPSRLEEPPWSQRTWAPSPSPPRPDVAPEGVF